MAKVLHGAPRSGSVGPSTFFQGRNGPVERQRVNPLNPQTLAQQAARSILATCASEWRGLTDPQRNAWAALAAQVSGNLTAFLMYIRINATLVNAGMPKLEDPPVVPAFGIMTCVSLTSVAGVVKLHNVADTVAPDKFLIDAAPQLGQGVLNVNSGFRRIQVTAGHTVAADIDISASYVAKFGELIAGQRIFAKITALKDGFSGVPLAFKAINA